MVLQDGTEVYRCCLRAGFICDKRINLAFKLSDEIVKASLPFPMGLAYVQRWRVA
jgi:hypothetical protein